MWELENWCETLKEMLMNLQLVEVGVSLEFRGLYLGDSRPVSHNILSCDILLSFTLLSSKVLLWFFFWSFEWFRWCGGKEDKYFARIGKNFISVYETESFTLIDKKSMKVDNVLDFSWSPTDPILALFVPEQGGGNQPARVKQTTNPILLHLMFL